MPTTTRIANGFLSIDVSSLGAEMQSVTTRDGAEWLWNGDATFWTGRSPVLFPIVGKAPDDTLLIDGEPHAMAQHGFARRREFSLAAASDTLCRYSLEASDETRAVYPFDFLLSVEHSLDGPTLTVAAEVENRGRTAMPFGLGFHPAFLWPLPGAAGRPHAVTLGNAGEPRRQPLEKGLLSQGRTPSPFAAGRLRLSPDLFENDALVFPEGADDDLAYGAEGGPALAFRFENLPNLALWTKPGAPFLCVEPWHGTAAELGGSRELRDRPYTTVLAAGARARFAFTVTFPA
ncbi:MULTISPECIES: aldose 1-epimerase family protein [unclassified Shinella]|uniref:aldose 1-epimerase family protein n=1 Tax=unclassified Shinella TaxID=2643062 RepID=UPI00225D86BC|nr:MULTISPECIES: aldose 1-epimerase family protein [unclassified Shinella]MCO5139360.1 aldose 1-epimerase family protein [Shinella sp.]MDC7255912.1 aldose 1-epimerase family protein [Shinella sp. YE25]CAI0338746.1 Aldose epimerase [Rhizobiaceae bacterium]CAK7257177.1 Aldose epimerase [Shinella sp. WSC3-e]